MANDKTREDKAVVFIDRGKTIIIRWSEIPKQTQDDLLSLAFAVERTDTIDDGT
jgi:hypothetical protein